MNNAKEIAEKIINSIKTDIKSYRRYASFGIDIEYLALRSPELARAYLDAANELETTKAALSELEKKISEAPIYDIYVLESEITKLKQENENLKKCIDMLSPKAESNYLNNLSASIHEDNVNAGWWTDLSTGLKKERNVGELLCLVHSEISESMEGYRKDLMDDKIPHRKAFEVELADALIRIFDIAGAFNLDLDGSIAEKRAYNAKRADHKLENRRSKNGKKF